MNPNLQNGDSGFMTDLVLTAAVICAKLALVARARVACRLALCSSGVAALYSFEPFESYYSFLAQQFLRIGLSRRCILNFGERYILTSAVPDEEPQGLDHP